MAEVVADPETDPNATYAVDPARVRALTASNLFAGQSRKFFETLFDLARRADAAIRGF